MTTRCNGGSSRISLFENPASANILSISRNVYASPAGVPASIVRLKAAALGGVTRSSLGMNSRATARPPFFSAALTFLSKLSFV